MHPGPLCQADLPYWSVALVDTNQIHENEVT